MEVLSAFLISPKHLTPKSLLPEEDHTHIGYHGFQTMILIDRHGNAHGSSHSYTVDICPALCTHQGSGRGIALQQQMYALSQTAVDELHL